MVYMDKEVLILGLTAQGLSVLRILSRQGIKVTAFFSNKRNVGRFSKYGEKVFFKDIFDLKNKVKTKLLDLNYKPLCYITSGEILASVLRDFRELYDICEVLSGPLETIDKLSHKDTMYEIALQNGFTVSTYITLDKYEKGCLKFPLFIKRNFEIPLFFKADYIPDEETLTSYINKIESFQQKDVILQEYISIPKSNLKEISVQGFYSMGNSKGFLIAFQEHKLKKGLTAYLEEVEDVTLKEKLAGLCSSFMKKLNYTGFAEFEFMYDDKNKDLYFIEVNTRTCGEQSALNYKFSNLAEVMLNPFNAVPLKENENHLRWINLQRDIRCRIQKKNYSNLSNLFCSCYDILDIHDLKPFFRQFL